MMMMMMITMMMMMMMMMILTSLAIAQSLMVWRTVCLVPNRWVYTDSSLAAQFSQTFQYPDIVLWSSDRPCLFRFLSFVNSFVRSHYPRRPRRPFIPAHCPLCLMYRLVQSTKILVAEDLVVPSRCYPSHRLATQCFEISGP